MSKRTWARLRLVAMVLVATVCSQEGSPPTAQSQTRTAQRPPVTARRPAPNCQAFTSSDCLRPHYLDSACGRANRSRCQPVLEQSLQHFFSTRSGTRTAVMRASCGGSTPALNQNGWAEDFHRRGVVQNSTGPETWLGQTSVLLSELRASPVPASHGSVLNSAIISKRDPAFERNTYRIDSCEEYVYEKFYDWDRYQVSVAGCRGDAQCVYDLTMRTHPPGLNRVLKRRDDSRLAQDWRTASYVRPKNPFYGAAEFTRWPFTRFGPMPRFYLELGELRTRLSSGQRYYGVGRTGSGESFANGFAFNQAMHERTQSVTSAENQEYQRRLNRLRELVERYGYLARMARVGTLQAGDRFQQMGQIRQARSLGQIPIAQMGPQLGLDRLILTASAATRGDMLTAAVPRELTSATSAGTGTAIGGSSSNMMTGSISGGAGTAPVGTVTSSTGGGSSSGSTCSYRAYGCPNDAPDDSVLALASKAFCRVAAFLAEEYSRGQGSCLDPSNYACDWNLEVFADSMSRLSPYDREEEEAYAYCKRWSGNSFTAANIADAEAKLQQAQRDLSEVLKAVPQMEGSTAGERRFGESSSGAETWGDLGSWGAGYDYEMGWEVKAWEQPHPPGSDVMTLCQLQGRAWGHLNATLTTPIDEEINSITGGLADRWNNLLRASATTHVNMADDNRSRDGQARVKASLIVTNNQIFPEALVRGYSVPIAGAVSEELSDGYETPHASFDVMIGPIPVSISAWAEFVYGGVFDASAKFPERADECSALYRVEVGFAPSLDANAALKVSVGIDGLLSIGIRGDVNLVAVSIPLHTKAAVTANSRPLTETSTNDDPRRYDLALALSTTADMGLTTLGGRVRLTVDYVFDTYRKTLFEWQGLGPYDIPLIEPVDRSFRLATFDL